MFFSKNKISLIVFLIILPIFFLFILAPLSAQDLGSGIVEEAGSSAGLGEGSLPIVLGKIFKIVLSVLGLVALILAIVAGVQWMTSGGNSEKIKKAKALLSAALIGLLIIILAYALVSFIVNKLTGVSGGGGGCTPGSCCADGLRCDENGQCTIADLACSTTFPSENFLLSRGEANFDANNQVYLCSNIRAVFNHNIKSNTVSAALNADALKVVDTDDNDTVEGEWQVAGKFITFTPDEFWEENTSYEMVIPLTISDSNNKYLSGCSAGFLPNGNCASLASQVKWSFLTNDQPDDISPFIKNSYPVKDLTTPDRNVSRAPVLEIIFNENIDYTTIIDTNHVDYDADDQSTWHPIAGNFQLCKIANQSTECVVGNEYNNDNLKVSLTSQGFRISLLNAQWLEAFGWYEIKVDGIEDMCGNVMEQSEAWTFQANDSVPGVQEWWPQGNNVCPDAPIGLRFGTSMYEQEVSVEVINTVTNAIEFAGSIKPSNFPAGGDYRSNLTTGNGSLLVMDDNDDEISNQFKIFQLELNSNLTNDSEYTIEINTDLIIDVDNNTLGKDWSFEVTNLQDCACAPIIYQTLPAQGPRGSCVTVTGYCFNGTLERPATINGFWFDDGDNPDGEISAEIMSSTSNSLTTVIPADFGEPIDDVPDELSERIKIVYEDNGEEVNIPSANQFTVISNQLAQGPCIWRLAPNQGKVSTNFEIKGIRLGSEEGNNYVGMNSWADHLNIEGAWTNEEIDQVVVPAFSTAGERDVKVAVFNEAEGNYLFSNPAPFDVIFDQPEVREFGCNPPPNYSSPSPYKNTQDACTGIDLMVEFTKNMKAYGANGVLNVANYTIRNCGSEENYNPADCSSIYYSPTNANFYDSSQNIVQLSLASSLSTNTWYQVSIQGNVRSQEEVAMGEDYIWHFKTRDNDLCPVAQIDLTPQNSMITGCSGSQQYTAQPVASNCNFLTASNYTYSWLSSQTEVATVGSGQNYQNTAQAIGGGYAWIKVTEDDSQKWTREKLTVNCCSSDQDCYDPDDDSTNRCAGSICDDTYGICTPIINDFSPSAGDLEDWVTINGCWFNNYNQSYSQVSFNEEVASIPFDRCTNSAWQNEQIIAEVPAEQGNPFGKIQVVSAPYGINFEVLSDSNFLEGDSYVGICNLRPDHGPTGLITALTTNDNLAPRVGQDAVHYGNQRAMAYPEPGWSVAFKEIRSQSPTTLPLGEILVKVKQGGLDSNYLSFNVDPTGGQPGDLCIEGCGPLCDLGAQFCENPYFCLQRTSGTCQDCRCCCQISDPESCGTELECLAGQGNCTGTERGLCCGCENDVQCGSAGCGFLDSNRCCYAHPSAVFNACSATDFPQLVGLNASFALSFDQPMDRNRMNNDYIKISKAGLCGNDSGEYDQDQGRCYLEGDIVSVNSENNNSTVFYPDSCRLSTNQEYKLEFIKGENGAGIRSFQGVSATAIGTEACSWDNSLSCANFVIDTATQEQGGFCAIETINVEPRDFIIKGLNNTHNFLALALDEDDSPVCVSGFDWESENQSIAAVQPTLGLGTTARSINYGETFIKASAEGISCSLSGDPYTCTKLKVTPTDLPQVVEQQSCEICDLGGQSPSPWKDSEENCPNAQIVVRFNRFLELTTINVSNILVKEFNPNTQTYEDFDYQSLDKINENSETIIYIDGPLSADKNYQVILKSGLSNEVGGLKDLSGLPLDGNKNNIQDASPLDDYVWEFSTGATNCVLNQVCVNPRQTTQINHPGNQVYYTDTYASNCNYLEASNFNGNYVWALINQQPANPSQEVAEFISSIDDWQSELSSKHLGEADVEVSINSHPQINDNGHLIVTTVPNIESSLPQGNEVCRNSIIQIGFDQVMEDDSLNADNLEVWRKYNSAQTGLNCEGNCDEVPPVGSNYPQNFLASLYYKIKNIFYPQAEAAQFPSEDCWCQWPLSGISSSIDENNKSLARLDAGLLNGEAQYKVVIKSGVESQYGIDLGLNDEWQFTTGELCELTRVEISPRDVYFNSAGLLENLEAQAFDDQGNEIFGVNGYDWDWGWQSSQQTVVNVNSVAGEPEKAEIISGRQEGISEIVATAQLNVGGEPTNTLVDDQISARVSICEYPWVYFDGGGGEGTNFNLFYCRDQEPLLPKLLYKGGEVSPSGCGNGILQPPEACDLYVGVPSHATCSFNCLSWECNAGYYKENNICLPNIPLAPSNLEVEVDSDFPGSRLNLTWNDNSVNEEFFKIERKSRASNWQLVDEVGANITSYVDSDLDPATKYYYRVRAGNTSGNSSYTTESWAITLCLNNQCYFNQACYNSEQCQPNSTQMCLNGEWINSCGDGILNCNEICDGVIGSIPGNNTHCQNDCLNWICDVGYGDCDGNSSNGCEINLLNNNSHCGECNQPCGANQSCENGICVCENNYGDCDGNSSNGCEINLLNNNSHCGECNHQCSDTDECEFGHCVEIAPAPPTD
ncbi:Ig-like domain-containing protein [Patescibacteria group bacterium]|nr:Ig-like domain-containing protein [Patescibacteria group bacterium]